MDFLLLVIVSPLIGRWEVSEEDYKPYANKDELEKQYEDIWHECSNDKKEKIEDMIIIHHSA